MVLVDDPAADLHEWYGRYLYFGPEELEPLGATAVGPDTRREDRDVKFMGITTTALAVRRRRRRVVVAVQSVPDIQRYAKIRRM